MEDIHTYLAKYKDLKPPAESTTRFILSVVRDECGIVLSEQSVRLERGGAFLSCHPAVRSELMRHAPTLLSTLHTKHKVHLAFIR